ncbi:MAG: hypothetical protein ACOCP8_00930 [archaeon]
MIGQIIGILGVITLFIGFFIDMIETINGKEKKSEKFIILCIIASILLLTYSIILKDTVFIILNIGLAIVNIINLVKLKNNI